MPFLYCLQNIFSCLTRAFSTFVSLFYKFLIIDIDKVYPIKFRYRFDKYNTIAYITKFLFFCVRRTFLRNKWCKSSICKIYTIFYTQN